MSPFFEAFGECLDTFTMVVSERPVSANKGLKPRYADKLRKAAKDRSPTIQPGPLYARILWFHKHRTTLDVDNIAKRILDALKGIVFVDDADVSHCLAARIDATIDYVLSGSPPSERDAAGFCWSFWPTIASGMFFTSKLVCEQEQWLILGR